MSLVKALKKLPFDEAYDKASGLRQKAGKAVRKAGSDLKTGARKNVMKAAKKIGKKAPGFGHYQDRMEELKKGKKKEKKD